jgi:nucleotide-binding universal stress UspA family protein
MKVLIAIDGSPASMRAVDYVLTHHEVFGAKPEITLVNVHLPVPSGRAKQWVGKEILDAYYSEEAEAQLTPARERIKSAGRNASELKLIGNPGDEIAKAAKGQHMIVMGTHGRSALGNLVMGSVATRTVAVSETPVLLIK